MESMEWLEQGRELVANYLRTHTPMPVQENDVFVVWFCKTLQNKKALFGCREFASYFELTADEKKGIQFLDIYDKQAHIIDDISTVYDSGDQ